MVYPAHTDLSACVQRAGIAEVQEIEIRQPG
jgi:hypothetical protein